MDHRRGGFTLVEMLAVMAVMVILIGLSGPVVNALKNSGDVTSAAYDLSDTLTRARASALANNTYVWVGFFEEDGSQSSTQPATPGKGRIVVSTVYSKDGTSIYDPNAASPVAIDPTRLGQYGRLLKIDHAHLTAFAAGSGKAVAGSGSFAGRPPAGDPSLDDSASSRNLDRISDQNPAACKYTFAYPLGSASAQYTFTKMIQFSPRGEARINCVQNMEPVIEIGLIRSIGSAVITAAVETDPKNIVAIQMTGVASNLTIYRP